MEEFIIITFETTSDAIGADKLLKTLPNPGRLVPVPRNISAGCGYAYKDLKEKKESIINILEENKIIYTLH